MVNVAETLLSGLFYVILEPAPMLAVPTWEGMPISGGHGTMGMSSDSHFLTQNELLKRNSRSNAIMDGNWGSNAPFGLALGHFETLAILTVPTQVGMERPSHRCDRRVYIAYELK
jgi:hypothetical protein